MDNRTLRSKRSRPRSAGPYDRQNQGILGKFCSTVKGLLNPTSWLSQWYGNSEDATPGCSTDVEDTVREDNDIVSKSVSHGSKRLRLRVEDRIPSIQSSATQTWSEQPSTSNLYEPSVSHVPSSTTRNTLLDNKESLPVLNGDDHSENSEGSASTSGCSSLVSSHKDNNRLANSPFQNIRSDLRNSRNRRDTSTSKSGELNSSRSLWSSNFSPSAKFQRRLPTISSTNQPNFNLSSFVGPSKLNQSAEKKVLSPFYEGKTTFGGASAVRRMPSSVAPYQVEKTLRNQIKVREQHSDDNLEGMSSAAKRILLTLEKMSTPVTDAKKMPNTSSSPVDLSLYLAPPKSRRNAQFTPSIPNKGPPIADITTIAKLTNLKNYGSSRLRNTLMSSPVVSAEQKNTNPTIIQPSISETDTAKGGGGKMRNKLNQRHQSAKNAVEKDVLEEPSLPNIPLPISTLPKINFGPKPEKKVDNFLSSNGFKFSNPIQPDLSISNEVATSPRSLPTSSYDSKIETNSDLQLKPFVFSSPIEHDLPSNRNLQTENTSLPTCNSSKSDIRMTSTSKDSGFLSKVNTSISVNSPANSDAKVAPTWECAECWIRNPSSRTTCIACETSRVPKKDNSSATGFKFNNIEKPQQESPVSTAFSFGTPKTTAVVSSKPLSFGSSPLSSSSTKTAATWECSSCWVQNSEKKLKCVACEAPRETKETSKGSKSSSAVTNSSSVWECSSCWVRNPMEKLKCMACETPRSSKKDAPGPETQEKIDVPNASSTWECSSCWVRNPIKVKKCLACETLHPSVDTTSGLKDTNGFQFNSPIHNSPITFKFGNFVCTVQSTTTTSTLKFGIAASTSSETSTTTSGFKFGVTSNSGSSSPVTTTINSNFKFGLPLTSVDNTSSQAVTTSAGFKFGVPLNSGTDTSSSTVTTTTSSFGMPISSAASTPSQVATTASFVFGSPLSTSSPFCSSVTPVVSTKEVSSNSSTSFKIPNAPYSISENKQTEQSSVSEAVVTGGKLSDTKQNNASGMFSGIHSKRSTEQSISDTVITSNASETAISKEKEVTPPSVTACFGFTTKPLLDSKKSSDGFSVESGKEKSSTNTLPFSSSVFPISTTSKDKPSEDGKAVQSESKDKTVSAENRLVSAFQSTSQSQSISSVFSLPSNAAPGFKFGEKIDSSKTNASSTSVALSTTTTSTFSFSNNNSNSGSVPSSKASEIPSISSGLQPAIKTEDSKIPTSTTAVFTFGNSSAVTTTASSAFAFFPSSSASSTPASSVFTFGASSNAATSKPGGFTFKSLDKPQNAQTLSSSTPQSTAQGLNASVSASAPSGGFMFGTPKTEAQSAVSTPFIFGSGAASSTNTTAFSAFKPSQPANPTAAFQFGSQPTGSTAPAFGSSNTFTFGKSQASNQISNLSQNPASAFGSSTTGNFAFVQKNETSNQIPSTVSQAPALPFGSISSTFSFSGKNENCNTAPQSAAPVFGSSAIQPTFGNTSVPSFGGSDKPASGGFNFGVSSAVFQFGASNPEKKPAVQPGGFAFGTPSVSENNSFSTGFNMNTPPSFNFGATSTPAAPFQFAASASESPSGQSAPRKIRKAVRRVIRKD